MLTEFKRDNNGMVMVTGSLTRENPF
jgi:hypothetical protein